MVRLVVFLSFPSSLFSPSPPPATRSDDRSFWAVRDKLLEPRPGERTPRQDCKDPRHDSWPFSLSANDPAPRCATNSHRLCAQLTVFILQVVSKRTFSPMLSFVLLFLSSTPVLTFLLPQKHSSGTLIPERCMLPESLSIDETLVDDLSAHPITVTVRHLTEEEANPDAYKGDQTNGGTKSGLFRSSLLSAKEEEDL